jgi:hypothetical protein
MNTHAKSAVIALKLWCPAQKRAKCVAISAKAAICRKFSVLILAKARQIAVPAGKKILARQEGWVLAEDKLNLSSGKTVKDGPDKAVLFFIRLTFRPLTAESPA